MEKRSKRNSYDDDLFSARIACAVSNGGLLNNVFLVLATGTCLVLSEIYYRYKKQKEKGYTTEKGRGPDWGGRLDWYPYEEGDLTLTETGKLTFKNGWINITAASDAPTSGSHILIRRKHTYFKIQHCT